MQFHTIHVSFFDFFLFLKFDTFILFFEFHFYKRRHKVKKDDHGEGNVTIVAIIKASQEKGLASFPLLSKPPLSHEPVCSHIPSTAPKRVPLGCAPLR